MLSSVLVFSSCGKDDEEAAEKREKTLMIDGEPHYYTNETSLNQKKSNGMYLHIHASEDGYVWGGMSEKHIVLNIPPSRVSQMNIGDVYNYDKISIEHYYILSNIFDDYDEYLWDAIEGGITVLDITDMEVTIRFDKLRIEHCDTGVKHTIEGIAVLNSGTYRGKDKTLMSFSEVVASW